MMENCQSERNEIPDEKANGIELLFVKGWLFFERREGTADESSERTGQQDSRLSTSVSTGQHKMTISIVIARE